jgi:hypothetical protein
MGVEIRPPTNPYYTTLIFVLHISLGLYIWGKTATKSIKLLILIDYIYIWPCGEFCVFSFSRLD